MVFMVRKGYENTTIRIAREDNKSFGIIGTVNDLLQYGIFDYCDEDENKWSAIIDGKEAYFFDTREEAEDAILNSAKEE